MNDNNAYTLRLSVFSNEILSLRNLTTALLQNDEQATTYVRFCNYILLTLISRAVKDRV